MALVYACVYCKQNLLHISTFCKRSLWLIPGNITQGHLLYICVGTIELAAQWYLIEVDTHPHVVIYFFSQGSLQLWSGCFICWTSVENTDSFLTSVWAGYQILTLFYLSFLYWIAVQKLYADRLSLEHFC